MKIKSVKINKFRNLNNVPPITFDEKNWIILGQNNIGKSNLIKALEVSTAMFLEMPRMGTVNSEEDIESVVEYCDILESKNAKSVSDFIETLETFTQVDSDSISERVDPSSWFNSKNKISAYVRSTNSFYLIKTRNSNLGTQWKIKFVPSLTMPPSNTTKWQKLGKTLLVSNMRLFFNYARKLPVFNLLTPQVNLELLSEKNKKSWSDIYNGLFLEVIYEKNNPRLLGKLKKQPKSNALRDNDATVLQSIDKVFRYLNDNGSYVESDTLGRKLSKIVSDISKKIFDNWDDSYSIRLDIEGIKRKSKVEFYLKEKNNIEGKIGFDFDQALEKLSIGLKSLIILKIAFLIKPENSIILIDEPELHLHSEAQHAFLESLSEMMGNFIFASHSLDIILGNQNNYLQMTWDREKEEIEFCTTTDINALDFVEMGVWAMDVNYQKRIIEEKLGKIDGGDLIDSLYSVNHTNLTLEFQDFLFHQFALLLEKFLKDKLMKKLLNDEDKTDFKQKVRTKIKRSGENWLKIKYQGNSSEEFTQKTKEFEAKLDDEDELGNLLFKYFSLSDCINFLGDYFKFDESEDILIELKIINKSRNNISHVSNDNKREKDHMDIIVLLNKLKKNLDNFASDKVEDSDK